KKVDPGEVGNKGQTALFAAAEGNSTEIVKKLLTYETVNVNQKINGKSALHHAILNENLEIVKELVSHGADIHVDSDDDTTLITALKNKELTIAKYLLHVGVSCSNPDVFEQL